MRHNGWSCMYVPGMYHVCMYVVFCVFSLDWSYGRYTQSFHHRVYATRVTSSSVPHSSIGPGLVCCLRQRRKQFRGGAYRKNEKQKKAGKLMTAKKQGSLRAASDSLTGSHQPL